MKNNRRNFIKSILMAVGVLISWPAGIIRAKKLAISLDKAEKLKKVGGSTTLKIKGREIIFIREKEDSVRALSPVCTHQKCLVEYNREENRLDCPCHGSRYDLEGSVLHGPAEEPLESFPAYLDDQGRVIVSMEDE